MSRPTPATARGRRPSTRAVVLAFALAEFAVLAAALFFGHLR